MVDEVKQRDAIDTGTLRPQELEAVYAISRLVARSIDTDHVLDEIIHLARPVFIFDNMVLYVKREEEGLEPRFARAIGRGRTLEAELAWGEYTANDVLSSRKTILRVEDLSQTDPKRTGLRYYLGLPIAQSGEVMGALVFVRFGGPPYTSDQIHLAEFIADHVQQVLEHRQLVKRVADLEAKRRLDDLQDDFVATISHELLTPLGFIKGYATTLLREDTTWDEDSRKEFLTIIDEEADRLHELLDSLMDSSRLQAGTLRINTQPLRLETLLRDIALRAKSRSENLDIRLMVKTPGLQIQGDPARLAQVFENLLSNAAKYAPNSPITILLESEEGRARIRVADQGPGISAEHVGNLFKRFYRVPEKSSVVRGTGLGLYICRQIIEAHQGKISVTSTVGEGTTFLIELPCEHVQSDNSTSREVPA